MGQSSTLVSRSRGIIFFIPSTLDTTCHLYYHCTVLSLSCRSLPCSVTWLEVGFCFCLSWWKALKLVIDLLCGGTTDRQDPPQHYAFMCRSIECVCELCVNTPVSTCEFVCRWCTVFGVCVLTFVCLLPVFMCFSVCGCIHCPAVICSRSTYVWAHVVDVNMFCSYLYAMMVCVCLCIYLCFYGVSLSVSKFDIVCVCTWRLCANVGMFL